MGCRTYNFDPNYYPITPGWFIASYNQSFLALSQSGQISDAYYALALSLGNDVFFGCIVERFSNQGGAYAGYRFNVGEPGSPIPGFKFIQDNSSHALNLTDKLTAPLF